MLWTGERRTARRGADALRGAYPDHPPMGGQPPPGFRLRMPAGLRACPPPRLLICTAFLAAVGCCTRNASARDGERQEAGGTGRPGSAGGIVDRSTASREPGRQRAGLMRRGWRLAHIDKSHDEEHEELVGAHREGHDARQRARLLRDRARPDVRHAAARRGEQSARQGVAALPLLPKRLRDLGAGARIACTHICSVCAWRECATRRLAMFLSSVPPPVTHAAASQQRLLRPARGLIIMSSGDNEEPIDSVVFVGDAMALVSYGAVQLVVDTLLAPFATADPQLFTNDLPLQNPIAQGSLVAITWILIARVSGGYNISKTRVLPDALIYATMAWLSSSALLLGLLALLGSAGIGPGTSPAEVDFIIGSGTVVGGWRLVCASALPPPH